MIPIRDSLAHERVPLVTAALIVAGVVVYLVAIAAGGTLIGGPGPQTIVRWGAIPYEWAHYGRHCAIGLAALGEAVLCTGQPHVVGSVGSQPPTWVTAFSQLFIGRNSLELIVNLVLLAVFGWSLEDELGHVRFLVLYLLGGLVTLALAIAVAPGSAVPLVGNGGALATVLGAYLALRPRERVLSVRLVLFFFSIVEVPAAVWILAWVCFDVLFGALGTLTGLGADAGASYYVALCGLAVGALAVLPLSGKQPFAELLGDRH
ncbi:MAG: rhomboid family intramembrane serine protease [Solirubrobacteraceae bacterium]